jgi:putative endonuclease
MTRANQILGNYGEKIAEKHLAQLGYQIIDRNWRCALGEIDLIASKDGKYSIIEVKTRRGVSAGSPLEAITKAKFYRLRRLAALWATSAGVSLDLLQIDAVSVLLNQNRVLVDYRSAITL